MTKCVLLIFGLLLLVSGALGWFWLWFRPSPAEAEFVLQPLIQIPVEQIAGQKTTELNFITPGPPAFPPSIRRAWGDPDLVIAAISEARRSQYCFDSVAVTVLAGPQLRDLGRSGAIYGYASAYNTSCNSIGREFRLRPDETASIQLAVTGSAIPSGAEIVVMPTWAYTKDNLAGLSIDEDLRRIAKWSMVAGMFTILFSGFLFVLSKRKTPTTVDGSS